MPEKPKVNAGVGMGGRSAIDQTALRRQIEKRAYFRYCDRGCEPGHEVDDWLAAEQEVLSGHDAPPQQDEESTDRRKRRAKRR